MTPAYADTSFLISLYGNDAFTEAARAVVIADGLPILLCDLNRFEFVNALRLLRFRKLVPPRFVTSAEHAIRHDEQAGFLRATMLDWQAAFSSAEKLSARYTESGGNRAMGILHVSGALAHECERFYSFDERQRKLAQRAGLAVNAISEG
jgi:predicted nucleic acid-binding protein